MTEQYQVMLSLGDIESCAQYMTKFLRRRSSKMGDKQAFFVLLSAFMTATVEGMLQSGFDEAEVRSILEQAQEYGFTMRQHKRPIN